MVKRNRLLLFIYYNGFDIRISLGLLTTTAERIEKWNIESKAERNEQENEQEQQ